MSKNHSELEVKNTETGTFIFPHINEADEYEGQRKFKTRLQLDPKVKATADLIADIEEASSQAGKAARSTLERKIAEAKNVKDKKTAEQLLEKLTVNTPIKPHFDADGNETGDVELSFSSTESYKTKTGKTVSNKPVIFDASGKPCNVQVTHFSKGSVAFYISPYHNGSNAGVTLRLAAVQVTQVFRGATAKTASQFGFGKVDGGYDSKDDPFPTNTPMDDAPEDEGEGTQDHAF